MSDYYLLCLNTTKKFTVFCRHQMCMNFNANACSRCVLKLSGYKETDNYKNKRIVLKLGRVLVILKEENE